MNPTQMPRPVGTSPASVIRWLQGHGQGDDPAFGGKPRFELLATNDLGQVARIKGSPDVGSGRLFAWAGGQIRDSFQDSTWQAFWQTAVEGRAAQAVADELGMTLGAVYIAKSRVLSRLRGLVQQVVDEG